MAERKQDSLSRVFFEGLVEQQKKFHNSSNHEENVIKIDVIEKPVVESDTYLHQLAGRIVDEATSITPKRSASDVLLRAGIDTKQFTGQPEEIAGHMQYVGKRARKMAIRQNQRRIRKVVKRPNERPALGFENTPRRRARKIRR